MTFADVSLSPYDVKDISDTFKTVPIGAIGFALIGGACGWLVAALIEKLPAGVAVILGIGMAVALTGFNDPQLGIQQPASQQPANPCAQSPESCFHLSTTTTNTVGSGSAP